MRLRLALLASILTFAGSIAGFHASAATTVTGDEQARAAAETQRETVATVKRDRGSGDCPEDTADDRA